MDRAGRRPAGADSTRAPGLVSAVMHAVDVLNALSRDESPLGVNEIARSVGLHKSTVSRILATLQVNQLVERNQAGGRFQLGVGLVALAGSMLSNLDIVKLARPTLEVMADESVSLCLWDGRQAVSVHQALGARAVKHFAPPGRRNPAHCTATGKAFLACLPAADVAKLLRGHLEPYTRHTITDPTELLRQLDDIRRRGFAVNEEEFVLDVCAVAASIRDLRDDVVAVVCVTVPKYRFTPEHREFLTDLILRNAGRLSRRLGHAGSKRDGKD
jgi:DNA-binding IclR family transcriptional regulator